MPRSLPDFKIKQREVILEFKGLTKTFQSPPGRGDRAGILTLKRIGVSLFASSVRLAAVSRR